MLFCPRPPSERLPAFLPLLLFSPRILCSHRRATCRPGAAPLRQGPGLPLLASCRPCRLPLSFLQKQQLLREARRNLRACWPVRAGGGKAIRGNSAPRLPSKASASSSSGKTGRLREVLEPSSWREGAGRPGHPAWDFRLESKSRACWPARCPAHPGCVRGPHPTPQQSGGKNRMLRSRDGAAVQGPGQNESRWP